MKPESYDEFVRFLRLHGYEEAIEVREVGQVQVRGDVIVVWPAASSVALRLHFFGASLEKWELREGEAWKVRELRDVPTVPANTFTTEHGELRPGDYIVHPYHGVGIFQGIVSQKTTNDKEASFVALLYAGNDRLLVPADRQDGLMPYIGTRHPRLTRLYSQAWKRTKERVEKDLIKVARELLKIYAARQLHERPPYPVPAEWLGILNDSVDFSLTDDQTKALAEIQHDLSVVSEPMDRLLCGDVGFGKTEVALRAAVQVIAQGKQVALVAPTTVLVEQHYALLQERLRGLPIRVAHMSRLTKGGDASTLGRIKDGTVDLVVGTHRVLGKDLEWHDLGMLVLDEEQKFGVSQKERLKKLRPSIDVLSLSATPIPRTLSLSLSGLRGLSILRHAPKGRLPVRTEVGDYADAKLKQALLEELERNGQVYVVHNRVRALLPVKQRVEKLLAQSDFSGARIGVAHGQLGEEELARTMAAFMAKEIDILIASTIVEHGLDSPHANSLVVLRSEHFGLSDLYQLRGRVGRRSTQAFAHFFIGGIEKEDYLEGEGVELDERITEKARMRLNALMEADALGSGWSIALRDLEIRGGGNILGNEQHGNLESIGLLLYAQLLQEEIGRQAQKQGISLFQKKDELA